MCIVSGVVNTLYSGFLIVTFWGSFRGGRGSFAPVRLCGLDRPRAQAAVPALHLHLGQDVLHAALDVHVLAISSVRGMGLYFMRCCTSSP